jgi:hypothetical protein
MATKVGVKERMEARMLKREPLEKTKGRQRRGTQKELILKT